MADTHGRIHPAAPELISARDPTYILHAGDVGEMRILDDLKRIAPALAVRGNIDGRSSGLYDILTLNLTSAGGKALTIVMTHIGLARSRLLREVRTIALAQEADLVVCAHSHIPWIGTDSGVAVFNPGSAGPRRFNLPITFGAIDIAPEGVKLSHIDCETGRVWRPEF